MAPPDECIYCEVCGDCLTCEPECWCDVQVRMHMDALTRDIDDSEDENE